MAMRGGTAPCCLLPACCIVVTPLYFVSTETPEVPERSERDSSNSPRGSSVPCDSQQMAHSSLQPGSTCNSQSSGAIPKHQKTEENEEESNTVVTKHSQLSRPPNPPLRYASSIPWLGLTASRPQTVPLLRALAPKAPKPGYAQLIGYHQSAMTFQDADAPFGWPVMLVSSCTILRVPTCGGMRRSSQLMHLKNCKMEMK